MKKYFLNESKVIILTDITAAIPADIHAHSALSPDGCDEPIGMARRAYELGIKHFALTDHIETDKLDRWDYAGAIERSHTEFLEIREEFSGRMEVYYGAELGQPLYDLPAAEKILAEHGYDFVLGSLHRTRTYEYFTDVPQNDTDRYRCLDEYFTELLSLAQWGKFCSLSHLTFPLRFIGGDIDISRYDTVIDEILRTIIRSDIALEVNSSGIRKGLGVPLPPAEYVSRYRALGGRMITIGSDAHRLSDVGADIPRCIGMLKSVGFSEICVFRAKQPVFIKI